MLTVRSFLAGGTHFVRENGRLLCDEIMHTEAQQKSFGEIVNCKYCWTMFGTWQALHPRAARMSLEAMVMKGTCHCGVDAWCACLEHSVNECSGSCPKARSM